MGNTAQANLQAAALQIAIWKALYDSGTNLLNLMSGNVRLHTAGIWGQTTTYLNALSRAIGNGSYMTADAVWLNSPRGQQDQVTNVPEPESTLFLLLTFAGIFVVASRYHLSGISKT